MAVVLVVVVMVGVIIPVRRQCKVVQQILAVAVAAEPTQRQVEQVGLASSSFVI